MAIYEIYTTDNNKGSISPEILIYKDKFSILAFLFPPLWLILNRNLFLIPFYCLFVYLTIIICNFLSFLEPYYLIVIMNLLFALQTSLLREWILKFKDYHLYYIVDAFNMISAYNKYIIYAQSRTANQMQQDSIADNINSNKNADKPILNIF
tara:strand:+ start:32843 stop:33298 length:456 start_codon:yes stop_codon:yes gene_type:complete